MIFSVYFTVYNNNIYVYVHLYGGLSMHMVCYAWEFSGTTMWLYKTSAELMCNLHVRIYFRSTYQHCLPPHHIAVSA